MLQRHVIGALDREQAETVMMDHRGNGGVGLTVLAKDELAAVVANNLHVQIALVVSGEGRRRKMMTVDLGVRELISLHNQFQPKTISIFTSLLLFY